MRHFIISQNLAKSGLPLPRHAIFRVNLAWHRNLKSVEVMLMEHRDHDIFLDIPIGRKKPPNHKHDLDEVSALANRIAHVKYVAISNVERAGDIRYYCKRFNAHIVPKIETYNGVKNLNNILRALNYKPPMIMLDHEDLFSNLVSLKKEGRYLDIVNELVATCEKKKVCLLRVKGIIFSDD